MLSCCSVFFLIFSYYVSSGKVMVMYKYTVNIPRKFDRPGNGSRSRKNGFFFQDKLSLLFMQHHYLRRLFWNCREFSLQLHVASNLFAFVQKS